jgi:SAM-dependent methyltransferase
MAVPDDYRADSRKRWDAQAAGWESRRDMLRASTMPVAAWMIDAIDPQPGHTLLELAAGTGDTGLLAAELIEPGGTLICSDFAPEMLAVARRRADELGIRNVRFKQIDADTSIDLDAAGLDGVLCRWGYMLLADPEGALRETRRVLRPGARVALAAWAAPEDNPWSALPLGEMVSRGLVEPPPSDGPGQFAWARESVIAEHLEAAGFGEHHVEALEFTYDFRSAADWWAAACDFSHWFAEAVERASDDEIAAVSDALDRHAERFTAGDGTVSLPARTWVAWAMA